MAGEYPIDSLLTLLPFLLGGAAPVYKKHKEKSKPYGETLMSLYEKGGRKLVVEGKYLGRLY